MPYDFTDLILLVGTNPLPNYVVAAYWIEHNTNLKKIRLICSDKNSFQAGTSTIANNLKKFIEDKHEDKNLKFKISTLNDVSSKTKIKSDLTSLVEDIKKKNIVFHLNYTGGTKAMSTHIYSLLDNDNLNQNGLSYLDSRNFRLLDDDKETPIFDDMKQKILITVQDLVKLHDLKFAKESVSYIEPKSEKHTERIVCIVEKMKTLEPETFYRQLYNKKDGYSEEKFRKTLKKYELSMENFSCMENLLNFNDNAKKELEKLIGTFNKSSTPKSEERLRDTIFNSKNVALLVKNTPNLDDKNVKHYIDVIIQLANFTVGFPKKKNQLYQKKAVQTKLCKMTPNQALMAVNQMLPNHLRLFDASGTFNEDIFNTTGAYKDSDEFFHGKWLEVYVYYLLEEKIKKENKESEIDLYTNIKPYKEIKGENGKAIEVDFEIDVILIHGYQLTGISCTIDSNKGLCKHKGFEVLHRCRQMGGDEALSVLVTCLDAEKQQAVQLELETATGTLGGNILVLGAQDLSPEILKNKIWNFIN